MSKAGQFVTFMAAAVLASFPFAFLGQQTALVVLASLPGTVAAWVLLTAAVVLAVAAPVVVYLLAGRGVVMHPVARGLLVAFVVFFCFELVVGGVPDWDPIPLGIGMVVVGVSAGVISFVGRRNGDVA